MDTLLQDVRGGVRLLFKHRWLTGIAILMLAAGVGMNAAIFSVANAVLLRPLAISEPERLLVLWERDAEQPVLEVSLANFLDWRARNQAFANMAAFSSTNWSYELHSGPSGPSHLLAGAVVLTVSVLASYWPARRAMAIDPAIALRQ